MTPPDEWLAYAEKTDLTPKEHHYQEERRLFYVAVTRAQKKLYLLTPEKATSKFIKELPNTLMEDHPMTDPEKDLKTYPDDILSRFLIRTSKKAFLSTLASSKKKSYTAS